MLNAKSSMSVFDSEYSSISVVDPNTLKKASNR